MLLQEALRVAGWRSDIFVHEALPATANRTFLLDDLAHRAAGSDLLVYQFATASPIADVLVKNRRRRIVLNYHNVTPPDLYQAWDPGVAGALRIARRQLRRLAPKTALAVAVSGFNEQDLIDAGFRNTIVIPVLFDPDRSQDRSSRTDRR